MSYNKDWSSMNVAQRLRIKETLSYLKPSSRETKIVNAIRLHRSTTKDHMQKICEICMWLKEQGRDFITEAEFIKGGRADIVVLEACQAVEVLVTETVESFLKNKSKYPIPVIAVPFNDEWRGL